MLTREYRTVDKSKWPAGPWNDEPDKIQWQDRATHFPCLIVRNRLGSLCGYVGVPESHPMFGKHYDSVNVSVHGGLTFADVCQPHDDESQGVCHVPEPGESDRVWWLGFDCGHAGDVWPSYFEGRFFQLMPGDTYKTVAYVRGEIERLAKQLAEIAQPLALPAP